MAKEQAPYHQIIGSEKHSERPAYSPPIAIDFERYAECLQNADPNDPDVRELIEILFNIQLQIADLSWRSGSLRKTCGQIVEANAESELPNDPVIKSKTTHLKKQFEDHSDGPVRKGEGK